MHTVVQRWTCDYIQWYVQTTPPAAPKFDGERRVEVRQRWPESGHRVRHHCALIMFNHYVCLWSKLNGCMRQKGSNAFTFMDPGETRAWQKAKMTSAWLPPRHRSITTPVTALETWLLYQANVHGYIHASYLDRMLVSNSLNQSGKVFQVNRVENSILEMCAIRLNWMTMGQISSNRPTFRQE